MIKLIVIFVSLNVLNIYCDLDCGTFDDNTCGGLTSFKSKCHQFDSGCKEIQVDDGCKFDETHNCVEERTLGKNEKCYSYSYNSYNCRRIKHQCTSYIDDNCGTLAGINNLKQCTKLSENENDFCVEIDIDDSCQIKKVGDLYRCTDNGHVENDFNQKYDCKLDIENKSCKKQKKVCSQQTSNCNSIAASTAGKTCSKVKDETNCKEVTIDPKCQINNNGICIDTSSQTDTTKKCDFNSGKTTCEPRDKTTCEEYSSTSTVCSTITLNGKKCSKVNGLTNCKEVEINEKCQIDTNGNCIANTEPAPEATETCFFIEENTKCQPLTCENKLATLNSICNLISASTAGIECSKVKGETNCKEVTINPQCQIDDNGNCIDTSSQADTTKKCDFNSGKTTCEPRDKTCEEYLASGGCSGKDVVLDGTECYKVNGLNNCKEVEINEKCQIDTNGNCIANTEPAPEATETCFFIEENTKCQPLTCENKLATLNSICNSISASTAGIECSKVKGENNCKEVEINPQCQIDDNGNCIDTSSQTDTTKKCDFNSGKTTCEPRDKTCEEYLASGGCSGKDVVLGGTECYKVSGFTNCQEITIDSQCTIDNGDCKLIDTRPSGSCNLENKRCKFKTCSEYDSARTCNEVKGCVFLGSCKEFTFGQNCEVSNGICSDTDSPEDSENTKCLFDNEKPECKKREKKCENYTTNACNDLTYPNSKKKCVYDGISGCYEVELDNYCTVDDSGYCVEKGDPVLSDTEICDFISKTECKKRKRKCEELLSEDICDNYTPINNQFCFKYEGNTLCDVITVEDGCQINSSNKCVAKRKQDSCTLDKDNQRCYKSKSGASLLSLKIFSLLFLFFIC